MYDELPGTEAAGCLSAEFYARNKLITGQKQAFEGESNEVFGE